MLEIGHQRKGRSGESFEISFVRPTAKARALPQRPTARTFDAPGPAYGHGHASAGASSSSSPPRPQHEPTQAASSLHQQTSTAAASDSDGRKIRSGDGGNSDTEDEVAEDVVALDAHFRYEPLPCVQGTWFFDSDGLLFDSSFDSGNLMHVERTGPLQYNLYLAPDCANSPRQTGNRQWFHFSLCGGAKGTCVKLTVISIPFSKMYTFGYSPVAAVPPFRSAFIRLPCRCGITKLEPPAPPPSTDGAAPPSQPQYINLSFEYVFEYDSVPKPSGAVRRCDPGAYTSTPFLAQAHPYPYAKLQRALALWDHGVNTASQVPHNKENFSPAPFAANNGIYFHRELLTRTLDGNRLELLTISGNNGMARGSIADSHLFEPLLDDGIPIPLSASALDAAFNDGADRKTGHSTTNRARRFPNKKYVALTARVHPGEAASSHVLHGAIEFLLSRTDPRAAALREHFVFVIVPMINPDGVVHGHSRYDTLGQNLNRKYRCPSKVRHPTVYAVRKLLFQLQSTGRLALYIDLHAHANKKGMFFYGNAMAADKQVQNLMYPKLVSLNTPYFDFPGCNFSQQNMFAVGKNGEGKDGSSRVTLFQETGLVHCYTLEVNYVTGNALNPVAPLPDIPGEEIGFLGGGICPKYTCASYGDTGKALLVSLLDLHSLNPMSRLPSTSFRSLRGVAVWVQRALIVDAWEQQRRQNILKAGLSISRQNGLNSQPTIVALQSCQFPDVVTTQPSKVFPPTTTLQLSSIATGLTPTRLVEDDLPPRPQSFRCRQKPKAQPTRAPRGSLSR